MQMHRITSVDHFRGFTILLMVLTNYMTSIERESLCFKGWQPYFGDGE